MRGLRGVFVGLCGMLLIASRGHGDKALPADPAAPPVAIEIEDAARHRTIPVLLYGSGPAAGEKGDEDEPAPARPHAILSHGYGLTNGDYGFLARALVARGYVVAAIAHVERPGDPPMVAGGDLAIRRRPVWQIGADSISRVIAELHHRHIADHRERAVVIGHSNGGDMTMLFTAQHPELVRIALSLDNRRMPLPRTTRPRICSLRSSDQRADPGILPTPEQQKTLGMTIANVPVPHDAMTDAASLSQQEAMLAVVAACLDGSDGGH